MLKVTFFKKYQIKEGRKMVQRESTWTEEIKDEASARLRAMALNWTIVSMELVRQ